ncbi:MAG: hypothetical protein J7K23_07335 [Thermoproteales archaeon]|nr:hypothetical protein [Thermoproteales archaeon]
MEYEIFEIFKSLLENIISLIPNVLLSIGILIVGYLVGKITAKAVTEISKMIKLDESFKNSILGEQFTKAGFPLSHLLNILTRLVIYTLTILAALSVLNVPFLDQLGMSIVLYLPKFTASVIIFLLGIILTEWLSDMFEKFVLIETVPKRISMMLSAGFKYFFYLVLIFIVFEIADIAPSVIASIAQAVFLAVAVSVGFTFVLLIGLGLKDEAILLVSKESDFIKPGIYIEANGIRGKIRNVTTFLIEIVDDSGVVHIIPKRKLLKDGFKVFESE